MATAIEERSALIERWIHYDAIEVFVQALAGLDEPNDEEAFPMSVLGGEAGEVDLGAGKLADQLWPTEGDFDTPPALSATSRSNAAVARMFALLATDKGRDYCATQAAFYAKLAAEGS